MGSRIGVAVDLSGPEESVREVIADGEYSCRVFKFRGAVRVVGRDREIMRLLGSLAEYDVSVKMIRCEGLYGTS
ncbi:hypothetical protein SAMN05216428_102452 [Nitrosospira sp. Nsp11]|nr:hypothetical protein SAMN05216428_102452 [Nitrosospira sp. Nsp11]